jgi:hypothetical protein
LVSLTAFISCCNSNTLKNDQTIPNIDFAIDAIKIGTLKIPLDSVSSNKPSSFKILSKNGEDYFTFLNTFNNSIYYFNLKTQIYDSIQQFPEQGPNGLGKFKSDTRYEFMGDSILFYHRSTLQMIIVNAKKEVIYKYNFGKEGKTAPYGMTSGWAFKTDEGFNFSSVAQTPFVVMIDLPDSLEFEFSLDTKQVQNKYNPLPKVYEGKMWMLEQMRYYRAENDEIRVYSYPVDDYIQVRETDGSFTSKYFGSQKVKPIVPIASMEVAMDMETGGKYYFGQGRYSNIYYDPFRKLFLRAAYSGMNEDLFDMNNLYGDTTSFDKVFIISDENMRIKGELQNDCMIEWIVFFQPNGIYVLIDNGDEEHLTFDIYDFEER